MILIAVVGTKRSGKTKTIEALVRGLTSKGYRVATAKHVPEQDFTIDTQGKDTWRYAQAGAGIVVLAAPRELTTIRKRNAGYLTLEEIVQNCSGTSDMLILEGFKSLVEKNPAVLKIVTFRTAKEALDASRRFKPIMAFSGSLALPEKKGSPIVDVLSEPEKLVSIVERYVRKAKQRAAFIHECSSPGERRHLKIDTHESLVG